MHRDTPALEGIVRLVGTMAVFAVLGCNINVAEAASFQWLGMDGNFSLAGTYSYAVRLEAPSNGVINTPGRPQVPIPEALKYPESNNFDDGDRNFARWDAITNRASLFAELDLHVNANTGIRVSGDTFYDDAYRGHNANTAPDRLNTRQQPPNSFTDEARYYDGNRARFLDAYIYSSFRLQDIGSFDVKLGRQVTAWGQSLFFSGVALAQNPADATKSTVPGINVKSILLPVNQLSTRITLSDGLVLLGQWKLEYKPTELYPTGSFFSVADLIGPGAKFAYGIRNPVFLDTLSRFDLTNPADLQQIADVLGLVLQTRGVPTNGILSSLVSGLLNSPLRGTIEALPTVSLPAVGNLLGAPQSINVERERDIRPHHWDTGQWGLGAEYTLGYTTTLGYYHLNYTSTNPTVIQQFGYPVLIPAHGAVPALTGQPLGLSFPVIYHVKYFDDIKMDAMSISTTLMGVAIGGELVYRNGIDVLVDVDSGLAGPIPTPTRAKAWQLLLNGLYTLGPGWLWDSLTLVGAVSYLHIAEVQPQPSQANANKGQLFDKLTNDRNAAAFAGQLRFTKNHIFPGWTLEVPISVEGDIYHHPAIGGAFGSLIGPGDYRLGISCEFTNLNRLTFGMAYSGFLGSADFNERPLQDRDNLGIFVKYNFF